MNCKVRKYTHKHTAHSVNKEIIIIITLCLYCFGLLLLSDELVKRAAVLDCSTANYRYSQAIHKQMRASEKSVCATQLEL